MLVVWAHGGMLGRRGQGYQVGFVANDVFWGGGPYWDWLACFRVHST